jgi:hypothetical protein
MAIPKKPPTDGMDDLVARAASVGESYEAEDDMAEDEEPMKEEFLEMCRAIREGDDEAAWEAYKACTGKA